MPFETGEFWDSPTSTTQFLRLSIEVSCRTYSPQSIFKIDPVFSQCGVNGEENGHLFGNLCDPHVFTHYTRLMQFDTSHTAFSKRKSSKLIQVNELKTR